MIRTTNFSYENHRKLSNTKLWKHGKQGVTTLWTTIKSDNIHTSMTEEQIIITLHKRQINSAKTVINKNKSLK